MSLFQFVLGERYTKDGRFRSLIPAKVRRVNINIVDMSEIRCQLDDNPSNQLPPEI